MDMHRPSSLNEALALVSQQPDATVLAGGTDVMVEVNHGIRRPESVIALRRIEELAHWSDRTVGAGVTYARMEHGPIPALAQAARTVGSPQIRSVGTIGGNVGTASPAGDTLPVIAALDAEIEVGSTEGRRFVQWDDFIVGPKRTSLAADELILGVRFPEDVPARQGFAKIGIRNAMVISIASCAVFRAEDGATTVALGSVGPTPVRARGAEAMISAESSPSATALSEFQRLVSEEVTPITDHRSTEQYRRHASGVLARRLLERILT